MPNLLEGIAREIVRAFRKDVTVKCYGGMRQFGKVDIPQEAFIAALKVDV